MLKNISRLEHVIAEKVFHLSCDADSPLQSVKEALLKFLQYVSNIEDDVKAQQEQAEAQKKADEAPCESKLEELEQPKVE